MHVEAQKLRLTNIGQLIEVVASGATLMGKLERVKFHTDEQRTVTLRVSGDTINVEPDKVVHIRRSAELYELHQTGLGIEDLIDANEKKVLAGVGVGG